MDFLLHPPVAGGGVVVGEGHDVEAADFPAVQDIKYGSVRLLKVGRCRRVQMQIGYTPLSLGWWLSVFSSLGHWTKTPQAKPGQLTRRLRIPAWREWFQSIAQAYRA